MSDPHWLKWFDMLDERFAGRYIRLIDTGGDQVLKLYSHQFPSGNYTYLALPADKEQLQTFLRHVARTEEIDL